MQKSKSDKIILFLQTHTLIPIKSLEEVSGVPFDCVRKAMEGKRNIPDRHIKNIENQLKKYGYK